MSERATVPAEVQKRLDELSTVFADTRSLRRMSLRDVADESGVSFVALGRFENGGALSFAGILGVLSWLHLPLSWLSGESEGLVDAYQRGWDDCAAAVRVATEKPERAL